MASGTKDLGRLALVPSSSAPEIGEKAHEHKQTDERRDRPMSVSNVLANYREFGLARTLVFYKKAILNKFLFYRQFQGMIVTMETLDPQYLEPTDRYEYRFLSESELFEYSKDESNHLGADFLEKALAQGDRCFAVVDDGELASYGWYSEQPTEMEDQFYWFFDRTWVYMYKGYTKPAYRGQRLHAFGMAKALKALTDEGAAGLVSNVETCNFRSLNSVYRMGYRNIGKITITRLQNICRIRTERACAPYGITIRQLSR